MADRTEKTLDQLRSEILAGFGATVWASYRYLVKWLREKDVASRALTVGDSAPDFLLPDADGHLVSSEQLRQKGPLVVSFFRGGWCPFCTAELCALQAAKEEFEDLGASLVVLTPDTKDFPRQIERSLGLNIEVLSDVDYGVAVSYCVLFAVPEQIRTYYLGLGVDLAAQHGSSMWMLPLPATYIVDRTGRIRSAFVEPDFTIRQEPFEILEALHAVAGEG